MQQLAHIRFVMVETTHSGNVGACARAMKTMGLTRLSLVNPLCQLDEQAYAMASGAIDILDNIERFDTLEQAIADCQLVVGASARSRSLPWPMLDPDAFGAEVMSQGGQVAVLLGREASGLTNEELALCHYHVHIPANPEYSSLNVAAAAQLLAWACRRQALLNQSGVQAEASAGDLVPIDELASAKQLQSFFDHWQRQLVEIGFLDPNNPKHLVTRLRRFLMRAKPEANEINIMRGILTETDKTIKGRR